ncbi:MAG: hypothetical protein K9L30_04315 [Desulfobacterales bacterium]|nr:hypothetical protein [Desulfobacterales bacterium]
MSDQGEQWQPTDFGNAPAVKSKKKVPAQADTDNVFSAFYEHETEPGESFSGYIEPTGINAQLKSPEEKEAEAREAERKKAYDKGLAQGEQEGKKKAQQVVNNMQTVLDQIEGLWAELVKKYENEIINLVLKVAEKVVCGKAAVDDEMVKDAILNAFTMIPQPSEATIRVNPEDFKYIETVKSDFFEKVKTLKQVSVISDPAVGRGGCKVETSSGKIDSSLASRLELVKQSIIEAHGGK